MSIFNAAKAKKTLKLYLESENLSCLLLPSWADSDIIMCIIHGYIIKITWNLSLNINSDKNKV